MTAPRHQASLGSGWAVCHGGRFDGLSGRWDPAAAAGGGAAAEGQPAEVSCGKCVVRAVRTRARSALEAARGQTGHDVALEDRKMRSVGTAAMASAA